MTADPFSDVRVIRSARRRTTISARLVGGVLEVTIPHALSNAEEAHWVQEMGRRLSRRRVPASDGALAARARRLSERYLLPEARSVRWSDRQGQRWGSCTIATGDIRISSRLSRAPMWVLDYVLVHELAHLLVDGHGERFRQLEARYERCERAIGFLDGWGLCSDDGAMTDRSGIVALDHVQLAMPAGPAAESNAVAFYEALLGIPRVPKPEVLAARGGCWFERPPLRLHLGVEADFRPARKAHPTLAVDDLDAIVDRLRSAGCDVVPGEAGIEGQRQAYVADPFGNRIELIERQS